MAITQPKSDKPGVLMIGFIPVIREGLQAIMAKDARLNVVGDVPDGYDGLLFIKRVRDRGQTVNVVLTETRSGERDGVQATRLITQASTSPKCYLNEYYITIGYPGR